MKLLKRNTTKFQYLPYVGKTEILKDGKHTGKFELTYAEAIEYEGNISIPSGQIDQQLFGIDTRYTHILLMDNPDADIQESGLIQWKGSVYRIKAVRPSLNVLAVALFKTVETVAQDTNDQTEPDNHENQIDPTTPDGNDDESGDGE